VVSDPVTVNVLEILGCAFVIYSIYSGYLKAKTSKLRWTDKVDHEAVDLRVNQVANQVLLAEARSRAAAARADLVTPVLTPEQQDRDRAEVLAMDFGRPDPRGIPRIPGGRSSSATGGVIRIPPGGHVTFDGVTFTGTTVQIPLSEGDKAKLAEPVDKPTVWDRLQDDDP
jgi:hypothetical protein